MKIVGSAINLSIPNTYPLNSTKKESLLPSGNRDDDTINNGSNYSQLDLVT
ncbi:MAG: hypothetical protein NTY00_06760 [Deltaproteobacteria bacterium]|nr:hypothetical protein [Deltaproteobacteria bacterium]